jgi:hypothetical protein
MGMKTCKNGHKYDDKLPECPFCPRSSSDDFGKTVIDGIDAGSSKTRKQPSPGASSGNSTRIVDSPVGGNQNIGGATQSNSGRTRIEGTASKGTVSNSRPAERETGKLIGWFVTFSWNPLGEDYRIREGKTRIGSDPSADIVLSDALVSGEHAVLLHRNNSLRIRDSFSTNGTFVNGEDVSDEPLVLGDGDHIKIGNTEFKLRLIEEKEEQSQ